MGKATEYWMVTEKGGGNKSLRLSERFRYVIQKDVGDITATALCKLCALSPQLLIIKGNLEYAG